MNIELKNDQLGKLVFSGKTEKVKEMINLGVDLDQISSNGMTLLILAIEGDQPQILELLLKNGANPNKKSEIDGLTALHWAVDYAIDGMIQNNKRTSYLEPLACIRILLKYGAEKSIKNNLGKTVLDYPLTKEISDELEAK